MIKKELSNSFWLLCLLAIATISVVAFSGDESKVIRPTSPIASFSASSYDVNEGDGNATITVNLNPSPSQFVSVNYATADGSAVAGNDYGAANGLLTFAPGQTSNIFAVPIIDDGLDESDEQLSLTLSNPQGVVIGAPNLAMLTILDNDPEPAANFSNASYSVQEGAGIATISVALNAESRKDIRVNYNTTDGTATGSDYTGTSGTLVFAPGQTLQTFTVAIVDDGDDELNETVNLILSDPVYATLGTPEEATLTIEDDDPAPALQFSLSGYNVDENASSATITTTLNATSWQTITVDYASSDGTAIAGSDYITTTGGLIFTPGTTVLAFTVPTIDDNDVEGLETVSLTLNNPGNATLGLPNPATLAIVDDDVPKVMLDAPSYFVDENAGTAIITVTLSASFDLPVTVEYTTSDGIAIADSDYVAATGVLMFAPSTTVLTFTIPIMNNEAVDRDKVFTVTLFNPNNSVLSTSEATVTIVDDDQYMYYLPVIFKGWVCQPDLVIDSTSVQPTIAVTVTNTGNCSTRDSFWVDFEVEPNPPPSRVNDVCDFPHISCIGEIVWGVTKNLAPGERLTLLLGDEYYQSSLSNPWPAGTYQVCFFVDSANSLDPVYGGVREENENNNIICFDESPGPGPGQIESAGEAVPGDLPNRGWLPK